LIFYKNYDIIIIEKIKKGKLTMDYAVIAFAAALIIYAVIKYNIAMRK